MEITKIEMPKGMARPETGPMQFGDDWPGIFIRGDNAMAYAMELEAALEDGSEEDILSVMAVIRLAKLLKSCGTIATSSNKAEG